MRERWWGGRAEGLENQGQGRRRRRSFFLHPAPRNQDHQRLVFQHSALRTPHCEFRIPKLERRLHDAQNALDSAVRTSDVMKDTEATLAFLLRLNFEPSKKSLALAGPKHHAKR
jgi:hypothetical protein